MSDMEIRCGAATNVIVFINNETTVCVNISDISFIAWKYQGMGEYELSIGLRADSNHLIIPHVLNNALRKLREKLGLLSDEPAEG